MTPAQAIASLDATLAEHGQPVTLRRLGSPNVDVTLPAFVRGYQPNELVGGIVQGDTMVTISPTGIGTWPSGASEVPKKNDKVVIAGRLRNVEMPDPIYLAGTLVRVNLQVRG